MTEVPQGYPKVLTDRGAITPQLVDNWNQKVSGMSLSGIRERIENGMQEINGHRVFIERGENPHALNLTYGEFGVAMLPRVVMGALAAADFVGNGAGIAIVANNTKGETNLNFSRGDKAKMMFGSADPIVEVGKRTRDYLGNPKDLVIAGASLGAISAMTDLAGMEGTTGVLIEPPNVLARDPIRLALNTNGNGKSGEGLIQHMYQTVNPRLYDEVMAHKPDEDAQFEAGMMLSSNLVTLGMLMRGNAKKLMTRSLDNSNSIAHGYGNVDKVSPYKHNERLHRLFAGRPNYVGVPALRGEVGRGLDEHCASGHALYVAAMTKLAYDTPLAA